MARGRPDYSPTAVDVVLRPEWAAIEGKDVNLFGAVLDVASGTGVVVLDYEVPAGKTFYLHSFAGVTNAYDEANGVAGIGAVLTKGVFLAELAVGGGAQGFFTNLSKPIVRVAGEHLTLFLTQYSGEINDLYGMLLGYLV